VRFFRSGGGPMLKMMGGSPGEHGEHAHPATTGAIPAGHDQHAHMPDQPPGAVAEQPARPGRTSRP